MCVDCRGTKVIHRPVEKVYEAIPDTYNMFGELEAEGGTVARMIGGIDACPTCSKQAEEMYLVIVEDLRTFNEREAA